VYNNKNKDLLTWTIRGEKNIMKFLNDISKYLIVKKRQSEIVIDFYKNITKQKDWKSCAIPESEVKRREKLCIEIQNLNKKCKVLANRD
jgi:hypothetical protein